MNRIIAIALAGALALCAGLLPSDSDAQSRKQVMLATKPAVAMVVAVDTSSGKLRPVASGSGSIVTSDGSVLTNHHVLNNAKTGKLHDLFIIGLFRSDDREPQFICAGKPSRGVLKPKLDLALIKCDMDMSGRPYKASQWPTVRVGRSEDVVVGEQVWVLGYPNVGGSTINVTAGLVSGWTGEKGGAGSRAYMKTDAAITHGNSGGTAIDEKGTFIGVPTAFRVSTEVSGNTVATVGKVGLIRPVEHARDLIRFAQAGWKRGVPAPASSGVTVRGRIVQAANDRPISGAFVVIFKPGIRASQIKVDKLQSQALVWAQTNGAGEFKMQTPVPRDARYTVAIMAKGYNPRVLDNGLQVAKDAADLISPWSAIRLDR